MKFQQIQFRSIRTALIIAFAAVVCVAAGAVAAISYWQGRSLLLAQAGDQLSVNAMAVADKIDRNLFERYGDVQAFAFHPAARGQRPDITQAANFFMTTYGLYDLMVVADRDGRIISANTVNHEGGRAATADLVGRSVRGQEWFEQILSNRIKQGETYYSNLQEDPWVAQVTGQRGLSLNFAAGIYDARGQLLRVWSNRASWQRIAGEIVSDARANLRKRGVQTAQITVLNPNGQVLEDEDSKSVLTANLVEKGVEAAKEIQAGQAGSTRETSSTGEDQVIGFAVAQGFGSYKGHNWGVLIRQSAAEAGATAGKLGRSILIAGLLVALLSALFGGYFASETARPLEQAASVFAAAGKGDLKQRLQLNRKDEIGRLGEGLNEMLNQLEGTVKGIREESKALTGSSQELDSTSQVMASSAEETCTQASLVSAASSQVSGNLQTVASAADEMQASIREISRSTSEAARVARQAVTTAENTTQTIQKLSDSSTEIGKVIQVITSIAEQTNLLALNATIEAARAGEAGKGFAVVANEVKSLAEQTAQATEDIARRIQAIQLDTGGAATAIGEITNVIGQINDISGVIASAVEEQSATTTEINQSLSAAVMAVGDITQNINGVATAAQSTTRDASQMRVASDGLRKMAFELEELVSRFH
jgi:methyl-accepting chemotaxis protein